MIRVLLVKMSSLGDVVHTLPAVTDARVALRDAVSFDWVVEEGYRQVAQWHPAVGRPIVIGLRRWRSSPGPAALLEFKRYLSELRRQAYDAVIDAQGLLKSALLGAWPARGTAHGYDRASAREPAASWFYAHCHAVPRAQHAVTRSRRLLAAALGYQAPDAEPDYGIAAPAAAAEDRVVLVPGASTSAKHWPLQNWIELGRRLTADGMQVDITWGDDQELAQAGQIAAGGGGQPAAKLDLAGLARLFGSARAMVSLDTGLSHLAAALALPNVCICTATDPARSGALGKYQLAVTAQDAGSAANVYKLVQQQLARRAG